jgi:hypothetical protein
MLRKRPGHIPSVVERFEDAERNIGIAAPVDAEIEFNTWQWIESKRYKTSQKFRAEEVSSSDGRN